MQKRALHLAVVVIILAGFRLEVAAHETDQFTTPVNREFADMGDELNRWAYAAIERGVNRANADIDRCLANGADAATLYNLRDPGCLVTAVHNAFPPSVDEIDALDRLLLSREWSLRYPGRIVAFMEADANIYQHAFFPLEPRFISRWYFAPTIKVYGTYLGTDKIGHFTDIGVAYYWKWREAIQHGATESDAVAAAVRIGTDGLMSESGMLGTLTTGDYSNGDLSANFAGFLFYRNLGMPTSIRGKLRPPMIELAGGRWRISGHVRPDSGFFALFISDHMDEALNPGFFAESMRPALRAAVRARSAAILWRYRDERGMPRTAEAFESKRQELATYWNVDYGHRGTTADLVTIAGNCFADTAGDVADPVFASALPALRAGGTTGIGLRSASERDGRAAITPISYGLIQPASSSDAMGANALHAAVADGDLSAVTRLITIDPRRVSNKDDFGYTPLHNAARVGSEPIVLALLRAGADPGAVDAYGVTPLHLACRRGHAGAAAALIDAGARSTPSHAPA